MEPWAVAKKKLSVNVAVPPASVRVPSQRPLAPSVTLVTSVANDKGDNEMILGAVYRSSGICLTAEENLLDCLQERSAPLLLMALLTI